MEKVCSNPNCFTSNSTWRYLYFDYSKVLPFCSACKLYIDANGIDRPRELVLKPKRKVRLKHIPEYKRKCFNCENKTTSMWRFLNEKLYCNACWCRARRHDERRDERRDERHDERRD